MILIARRPSTTRTLWLEEIDGEEVRAWVEARNALTREALQDAQFEHDRRTLLDVMNAADRIPTIHRRAGHIYNFWQDAQNPRGIWRRTTLASYRTEIPAWEIVLDIDALAKTENTDWVWVGCASLPPEHRHGLVQLSRGGADAVVIREFDLIDKRFVPDGFSLPEARSNAAWLDADTLLVTSVLGGEAFQTSRGWERTVRRWRRGTSFDRATVAFECEASDATVSGWRTHNMKPARTFYVRYQDLHHHRQFFEDDTGRHQSIDVPSDAAFRIHGDWMFVSLHSDWRIGDRTHAGDSLIVIRFDDFMAGNRDFTALFVPSDRRTLANLRLGGNVAALTVLDNVRSRIIFACFEDGRWRVEPAADFPDMATLDVRPLDAVDPAWFEDEPESDEFIVTANNGITPPTFFLARCGGRPEVLKQAKHRFDAAGLLVEQHEAVSVDGTRIPYFQVGRADLPLDGNNAVLMTGYGGAGAAQQSHYNAAYGKLWLERGGAFVIANIRGGSELGPDWHRAALREGKRLSHDDFAAVARNLITRGVTQPQRLACDGGSLGGLLVANMLTRYPELFGAISCAVPVLDLKRYAKLGAGGLHIAEFGDPDKPEDWHFMREMSAYHCIDPARAYPPILLVTSTRDDRAHPAHARKMAAELTHQGHQVFFHEATQGGHGIGTSNAERAFWFALQIAFLRKTVAPEMTTGPDEPASTATC